MLFVDCINNNNDDDNIMMIIMTIVSIKINTGANDNDDVNAYIIMIWK